MGYGSRQSTQNETQVAEKHFLKCPAFLARERQLKTTLRFHLTRMLSRMQERGPHCTAAGSTNSCSHCENQWEDALKKLKTDRPHVQAIPRYTPKELYPCPLLLYPQYAEKGTSLEAHQLMDREKVVCLHNGILFSY